ncbi:TonB-dependent receptor [Steroidobacter sp.]|uniref:TonB-dependent receptor n=1 Tax=Steroidobacter sp. TaxID=1978227 RepID=UPI001A5A1DD3|nr:TonB-dependent receptor [Steroidobacter sp.]MBL8266308.1 TonB-dependent receptor [Steroidobacter sp.]
MKFGRHAARTGVVALVSTLTVMPALGANEAAPAEDTITEVIVTATRRAERLQDVPIAISAVGADQLEKLSATSFADYARTVPGVAFVDLGSGRQKVSIRGINVTGGAPTVGYYVGDTPIPATGGTIRLTNIDPAVVDIERVEVLRGPQGTLFGAGAMGGAIRFIPKSPDAAKFGGRVEAIGTHIDGGGLGTELRGVLNMPLLEDRLAARIAVWHRDQEGFIDRRWGQNLSLPGPSQRVANTSRNEPHEETSGVRAALLLHATDAIDIETSVFHQDQQFSGFQHVIGGPSNPNGALVQNNYGDVAEPQRNLFTLTNLTARGTHDLLSWTISASRSTGEQEAVEDSTEPEIFAIGDPVNVVLATIEEWNQFENTSLEARIASTQPLFGIDYVVGAFYEKTERARSVDETNPGWISASLGPLPAVLFRTDFDSTSEQERTAPFAEFNYHATDAVTLTAGIRRDRISAKFGPESYSGYDPGSPDLMFLYAVPADPGRTISKTVTKFSAAWKLNDDVMIYGTRSEGFRAGSLSSTTAGLVPTCQAEAIAEGFDPDGRVQPDSVTNYEIGLKSTWGGRVTLNTSLYRIDWEDLQQTVFLQCGSRIAANAGSARSQGIEIEAIAKVGDYLQLGISGMVGEAEITDPSLGRAQKGDRIQQVPRWIATPYAEIALPSSSLVETHLRLEYQAVGSSYNDFVKGLSPQQREEQKLGSLGLLNARLWADYGDWQFALFGQNLLNDIETAGYAEAVSISVPGRPRYSVNRPRTFGVSLSRNF